MNSTDIEKCRGSFETSLRTLNRSEQTVRAYLSTLSGFIAFLQERNESIEISAGTVEEYREYILQNGTKSNTLRHYLICLSCFFKWAVQNGLTESNPIGSDAIPKHEQIKHPELLTHEEIMKLLNADAYTACGTKGMRMRAIILILLTGGLRNSELRDLRLRDLSFEQSQITVWNGKGGKSRVVPFQSTAKEAVKGYLNSKDYQGSGVDDYLFGVMDQNRNEWKQMSMQVLDQTVPRYLEFVIGRPCHPHALRHAAASFWDDHGVPMREIQNVLGHQSIQTTERIYVTVLNKGRAANDILERMEASFAG